MIKLYSWTTPNGRKVSIALEEMGLSYESLPVNIGKDEQFAPSFLKISPNNRIPAIVDGDVTLFESGAILMYLAQKSGKFIPDYGSEQYWKMMQWLMWQMGGFGPMLGQAHHFLKYNAGTSAYAEQRFHSEAKRLYGVLDRHLAQSPYIIDTLSIADFAIWPWASRFEWHQIDLNAFQHVKRWYLELAARPGFQRGYKQPLDAGDVPLV
ncbi:glutathione S-transferase N-terminal domain-containing protein [Ascidiaceihabitans sp.]|uniref:glutathione S-transferase family protein n=1 Tax=Ascidiaceihabitans sp. TaxID=1872644 RepID=UPI0032972AA2